MDTSEIKAELSMRMLELERAIDVGLPYPEIKRIYSEIKDLQLQVVLKDVNRHDAIRSKRDDIVIE
jgi:hypothetical protein